MLTGPRQIEQPPATQDGPSAASLPRSPIGGPTGIGRALRKARLIAGKSIEEASRETHVRAAYLQALEAEDYPALHGDVYVRAFLRSYSTYLGLDPDKVLAIYGRHAGPEPAPAEPPEVITRHQTGHHLPEFVRHHPSWTFLIGVTVLLLIVLGAVGLFSKSPSTPLVGPAPASTIPALTPGVTVGVEAVREVEATVAVDGGAPHRFLLRAGEARSFEGNASVSIAFDRGGRALLTVNGYEVGQPGKPSAAWSATYRPQDYRVTPSPKKP